MLRNSIGIEIMPEYFEMVKLQHSKPKELLLFDPQVTYETTETKRHIAVR
jgi:hypothetical protein